MDEKKMLVDEELEQVSGGINPDDNKAYCEKWYVSKADRMRYVYVKKANYDFFYTTEYIMDEVGNVRVKNNDLFRARILFGVYEEVSPAELPEAISRIAVC